MKLTYRGVSYSETAPELKPTATVVEEHEVIYRGNSPKARINRKFPWLKYFKQLMKFKSRPDFDPIAFWYDHKRKYLDDCWYLSDVEQLNYCWHLTLQEARRESLKSRQKTKLKYRGVTYYR